MADATSEAKEAVQPIKDWARSHVSEPVSKILNTISKVPSTKAEVKATRTRAVRSAERLMRKYAITK